MPLFVVSAVVIDISRSYNAIIDVIRALIRLTFMTALHIYSHEPCKLYNACMEMGQLFPSLDVFLYR